MAYSVQDGEKLQFTTAGAVANGQLLVQNRLAGVALTSATGSGQKITLALSGVFELAAVATGAKTQGNRVFYRTTGGVFKAVFASGTATGAKYTIGNVWETATAAATTVKVRLVGGPLAAI